MSISANRDRHLLSSLARRALPALVEMAMWQSAGHAYAAYSILGRVAAVSEKEIEDAWAQGNRNAVVDHWSELVDRQRSAAR